MKTDERNRTEFEAWTKTASIDELMSWAENQLQANRQKMQTYQQHPPRFLSRNSPIENDN